MGRNQRIVYRSKFTLNFGATVGTATEITLAPHVDVSQYREVTLYVRTHNLNVSGTWTIAPTLNVYMDGYTAEDPGGATGFLALPATQGSQSGSLILSLSTAPQFQTLGLPPNIGSLIYLTLKLQPSAAASYDAWLSIDMTGKA